MGQRPATSARPISPYEIPPEPWHESPLSGWRRRLLTVPGLILFTAIDLVLLPLLLPAAAGLDAARRRPWTAVRFHLALAWILCLHLAGLVVLFGTWLLGVRALGGTPERRARGAFRLEIWWAERIWWAAERLYRLRLFVSGEDALDGGPILLLSRHASVLDTVIPVLVGARRHGLRPRYVMKRELLWDPCLDVLGHRIPTAFVHRHGRDTTRAIALVEGLLEDLGPEDAIVFYPEGTRFTQEKQRRVLAALEKRDSPARARAARLRHVLPPHPAGSLALLEHDPGADVVFCAHTGLEGVNHIKDLLAGSILDRDVRVRYWRVPAREIPVGREAIMDWLFSWWERIDRWIDANRAEGASRRPGATLAG